MKKISSICIYCGSRNGGNPIFKEEAEKLGTSLAKAGISLVYGGGDAGIMGMVSSAARKTNGNVISIIPEFLINKETSLENLIKQENVFITQTMHERKKLLFEKSDAFIALPGGMGTLEELSEMLTWSQLNRHKKPIILANLDGFWNPLLKLINHMIDNGFILNYEKFAPIIANDTDEIIDAIKQINA